MPNASTALANENILIDATIYQIPGRAAISIPSTTDLNVANKQAAIDDMSKDADFGTSVSDLYGRVYGGIKNSFSYAIVDSGLFRSLEFFIFSILNKRFSGK
jgi:hypothetical protein